MEKESVNTYSMFRHGSHLHCRSLIYGPQYDVVLHEEISSTSESERDDNRRDRVRIIQPVTPVNIPGNRPTMKVRRDQCSSEGVVVEQQTNRKRAGWPRRRRFYDSHYLQEQLKEGGETTTDLEEAKRQWLLLLNPPRESTFQKLMENDRAFRAFEIFLNISMEKEEKLLKKMEKKKTRKSNTNRNSAAVFASFPKDVRDMLRESNYRNDIEQIQDVCVNYIESSIEPLTIPIPASGKVLCKAVASYYRLKCQVVDEEDGSQTICIQHHKSGRPKLPELSIIQFLDCMKDCQGYASEGDENCQAMRKNRNRERFVTN